MRGTRRMTPFTGNVQRRVAHGNKADWWLPVAGKGASVTAWWVRGSLWGTNSYGTNKASEGNRGALWSGSTAPAYIWMHTHVPLTQIALHPLTPRDALMPYPMARCPSPRGQGTFGGRSHAPRSQAIPRPAWSLGHLTDTCRGSRQGPPLCTFHSQGRWFSEQAVLVKE